MLTFYGSFPPPPDRLITHYFYDVHPKVQKFLLPPKSTFPRIPTLLRFFWPYCPIWLSRCFCLPPLDPFIFSLYALVPRCDALHVDISCLRSVGVFLAHLYKWEKVFSPCLHPSTLSFTLLTSLVFWLPPSVRSFWVSLHFNMHLVSSRRRLRKILLILPSDIAVRLSIFDTPLRMYQVFFAVWYCPPTFAVTQFQTGIFMQLFSFCRFFVLTCFERNRSRVVFRHPVH